MICFQRNNSMGVVKMLYLFAVAQMKINFVLKNKIATAFRSSSPEVFYKILFVEIFQNSA